jgi:methionyl-tRNA formyltransferase
MNKTFNIIFMGTPDYAVPSLVALHNSGHRIAMVVTQPDRPKGRGRKILPPPVKKTAVDFAYDIIQPETVKTKEFIDLLTHHNPDFFVVVAYGHILPQNILDIPKYGSINVHASLLPKYRGPAPIQWAVINGEKETGITTILMDKGMDTGDILLTAKETILNDDTAATLHDRLAVLGGKVLIKTLNKFAKNDMHPVVQDHSQATRAPILKKDDGRISWEKPAEEIVAFIRGMTPWPGAFTFHNDKRLKIFKAALIPSAVAASPGTVVKGFADELRVATVKGLLSIHEIQGESGKRLAIKDFLRGHELPPGTILG